MTDLLVHAVLFAVVAIVIAVCQAMYSEPKDRKAFASVPKRFAWLVGGCAVLAVILIVLEKTLARVS